MAKMYLQEKLIPGTNISIIGTTIDVTGVPADVQTALNNKQDKLTEYLKSATATTTKITLVDQNGNEIIFQPVISGAMTWRGSVPTAADLPTTGQQNGDFYVITADNTARVWNSTTAVWDNVGSATFTVDVTPDPNSDNPLANKGVTNNFVRNTDIGTKVPGLTDGLIDASVVPDVFVKKFGDNQLTGNFEFSGSAIVQLEGTNPHYNYKEADGSIISVNMPKTAGDIALKSDIGLPAVDGKSIIINNNRLKTSIGGAIIKSSSPTIVKSDNVHWGGYGTKGSFSDYKGKPGEVVTLVLSYSWGGVTGSSTATRTIRADGLFDKIEIKPRSYATFGWYFNGNTFTYSAYGDYLPSDCSMGIQIKSQYSTFEYVNYEVLPLDYSTIQVNSSGKIEVKDGGINANKIANGVVGFTKLASADVVKTISTSGSASDSKLATEKAIRTELDACLKLSGGTMTGSIVTTNSYGMTRNNTAGYLIITSGTDNVDGGNIGFNGATSPTNPGDFIIRATTNSSDTKILRGKPSGELTWNDKSILVEGDATKVVGSTTAEVGVSDLASIDIGGVKYNIPSGGSSSSIIHLTATMTGETTFSGELTQDQYDTIIAGGKLVYMELSDQKGNIVSRSVSAPFIQNSAGKMTAEVFCISAYDSNTRSMTMAYVTVSLGSKITFNGTMVSVGGGASSTEWGSIIGDLHDQTDLSAELATKQDISSLDEAISGLGYTKNQGDVNVITINGQPKTPTAGIVDLGTVITDHQSLEDYAKKSELAAIIDDTMTSLTTTWSSNELKSRFEALSGGAKVEIVETRPETGVLNTLYYVGSTSPYHIWLYANNSSSTPAWFDMGTTSIDLSGYYTKVQADSTFLKLTGGTMTGAMLVSGDLNFIKHTANDSYVNFCGGTTWNNGAMLQLAGKEDTTIGNGCFQLNAMTSESDRKKFIGKPDGTLTWDGNNVLTDATGLKLTGGTVTGPIKDSSGYKFHVVKSKYIDDTTDANGYAHLGLTNEQIPLGFRSDNFGTVPKLYLFISEPGVNEQKIRLMNWQGTGLNKEHFRGSIYYMDLTGV